MTTGSSSQVGCSPPLCATIDKKQSLNKGECSASDDDGLCLDGCLVVFLTRGGFFPSGRL